MALRDLPRQLSAAEQKLLCCLFLQLLKICPQHSERSLRNKMKHVTSTILYILISVLVCLLSNVDSEQRDQLIIACYYRWSNHARHVKTQNVTFASYSTIYLKNMEPAACPHCFFSNLKVNLCTPGVRCENEPLVISRQRRNIELEQQRMTYERVENETRAKELREGKNVVVTSCNIRPKK